MKTYVAEMRIRHNGELYKAGEKIELDDKELEALPKGAVSPLSLDLPASHEQPNTGQADKQTDDAANVPLSKEAQAVHDATVAAIEALSNDDFKKDGGIRADALRDLQATLGFEITAEDVAVIRAPKGA